MANMKNKEHIYFGSNNIDNITKDYAKAEVFASTFKNAKI